MMAGLEINFYVAFELQKVRKNLVACLVCAFIAAAVYSLEPESFEKLKAQQINHN
jgi:hypothetical protein